MSKSRRFRVHALSGVKPGDALELPDEEFRHLRVLRLNSGAPVEIFDETGRSAQGTLVEGMAGRLAVRIASLQEALQNKGELVLAVAWPKGKRAAILIEKCTELGVDAIVPLNSERTVVSKEPGSEGLTRLSRIAAEAAKQSRRSSVPRILPDQTLEVLLRGVPVESLIVLMDPQAEQTFAAYLAEKRELLRERSLVILVGPEGGFTQAETALAGGRATPVLLAENILRIETAAIAACAIARQF